MWLACLGFGLWGLRFGVLGRVYRVWDCLGLFGGGGRRQDAMGWGVTVGSQKKKPPNSKMKKNTHRGQGELFKS